jgi:hypothetical protein
MNRIPTGTRKTIQRGVDGVALPLSLIKAYIELYRAGGRGIQPAQVIVQA